MQPSSFVIVKLSSIGDVLQALPVAKRLKIAFPHAKISWAVESRLENLLCLFPCVDEVISFDRSLLKLSRYKDLNAFRLALRRVRYDYLFDLQGNTKSALVTSFLRAKKKVGFGFRSAPEWPNLLVTTQKIEINQKSPIQKQYLELVEKALDLPPLPESLDLLEKRGNYVMICIGSRWKNKQLHPKTWIAFLNAIQSKYDMDFVMIWGTREEKQEAALIADALFKKPSIYGSMEWDRWIHMIEQMKCVISVDSAGLHLAAACNVPTLSIFGPSSSTIYRPLGLYHESIQGTCPYLQSFVKRCPYLRSCPSGACIKEIDASALEQLFEHFWLKLSKGDLKADQNLCELRQDLPPH